MRTREGCGLVALGCLCLLVAVLVFAALAGAMVLSGQVPLYAPRLIGLEPEPSYPFFPTTPITLTFDQPMDTASVEASFSLEPGVPGAFHWNADRSQVVFVPEDPGFEPGTTYSVRLAAGAVAGTLPRTTEHSTEWGFSLLPLLDSQTPPSGEEQQPAWTRLEATFNYPLECALTLPTFSIEPQAVGLLECRDGTLAFNPTAPLEPGVTYQASFERVFIEGDPTPRPGVEWTFRTAPPLTILDVSPPADDSPLFDFWMPMRITFNRPVIADTAEERFSVAQLGGPPIPGQITWQDDGAVLIFQPDPALIPDARYRLALQAGVQDELGFATAASIERTYDTEAMVGPPLPVPGSQDVPLDSEIMIAFSRPMDEASLLAGVVLTPTLPGRMLWDERILVLVITPDGGLDAETVYEVALSPDIQDASGALLARPHRWSFATGPLLLETQTPTEETVLALQQSISFTFALPMDRASVATALAISPPTPGDLVWSDDDRTVAFRPDVAWQPGADYKITLSEAARTADRRQTLGQEQSWTFSTGVAEVQFGVGPNVQVLNAEGERAFQLVARGADVADFALYPLTPTQFLDLYGSDFLGVGPEEPQIVDVAALTPTVEWRELLIPLSERGYDGWRPAQARIPADAPPGLYLLSAEPLAQQNGQLLVALTRHALVLKRALAGNGSDAQAQIVAWDAEISGGAPVVSATLRLYDRDGDLLAEGLTDAEGLLTLDLPGDPAPLLALSTSPLPAGGQGDVTVSGLSPEWGQAGWWGWRQPPPSRPLYLTYSYTDRPLYRPGQTIYFEDWIRADDDVSYTLPTSPSLAGGTKGGLPITVRLRDARDNVAATQVFTPTAFGTVYGVFHLSDGAMLGDWNLETVIANETTRRPLKVEEYRKPEYAVTVQTGQKDYVAGDPISVTVETVYYFGQPVADANVALSVLPTYADDFWYGEGGPRFGLPLLTIEGRSDELGRWTAQVPTDALFSVRNKARRAALALEATVSDETGQSVSNSRLVVVQRSAHDLTLLLDQHRYEPGQQITFTVQMLDRNGAARAGAELTVRVLGWDGREVAVATATPDAAGQAHFSVSLAEQGWYRLLVTGQEASGRELEAADYVWIYAPDSPAPWYQGRWSQEQTLSIRADRTTYAVGDEAQLLIHSATPGLALLTFERGETRYAQPVALSIGANLITVPLRADFAPNVHVEVSQYSPSSEGWWAEQSHPEAELHTASTQLLIPMTDRRLTVTLIADQETYAPGAEAAFQVQVVDHQGQPVVAEVSLAVVDEALYALAEDLSPDPFALFYGPRPNLVRTFDSLRPQRWLFPPGLGGGGGEGAEGGATPRSEFLDTALWAPAIVTDENGQATVTLTLPDNLTEWRALARAVTTDTLVGQATTHVVVSQEIVLRPALPRFLVQGDAVTLTAVVHNFSAQPVSATVELEVAESGESGERVVSVPAGGSTAVGWPLLVEEPGQVQVTMRTTASRGARLVGRDAVELTLPVHPLAAPEVARRAGLLTPAQPTGTLTLTLPGDAMSGLTRLQIDLAPSLASGLLAGLDYLIGYPYGCVEQTMSRALPNALVARAFRELGVANERLEADLPPMIDLGLQKLYGYQHDDGGWGWWYDDDTDLDQTAYVLLGLGLTAQAGFDVDEGVIQRGAEALRAMLSAAPSAAPAQAYGAYALVMAGQPVSITLTLTEALELDLFSQAALAIALDATTASPSPAGGIEGGLLDNLREAAIQEEATVHWAEAEKDAAYSRAVMGSTVRTTALVADALARLDPASPLLPPAARWLMDQRQGPGWGDTQKTSFAILALTDYWRLSQEQAANAAYRVYVDGELWQEGQLDGAELNQTLVLTYTLSPALDEGLTLSEAITTGEAITVSETITPSETVTTSEAITTSETITTSKAITVSETITPSEAITASETLTTSEASTASQVVSPSLLQPGENQILIVLDAEEGQLYYAVTWVVYREPGGKAAPALQPHERSIGVQREYTLAGGEPAAAADFQRGDLVEVRLTLDAPQASWYLIVEDPLPAGFEALNERLGATSHLATAYEEPLYYWPDYGYNRKEVHDDRVAFFITRLEPGERTLTYLMRATTTGDFTALPTQVYLMYEPEVWSRAESVRVRVR